MNIVYALIFLLVGAVGATVVHKMTHKQQTAKAIEGQKEQQSLNMYRRSSMDVADPNDVQVAVAVHV
jgi:hypothetical protein